MVKLKFKKQIWQVQGRKALRASFRDSDGDGVINMFDCAPHNKRKQGEQHEEPPRSKRAWMIPYQKLRMEGKTQDEAWNSTKEQREEDERLGVED